jgi:glycine/D-amino acid oxidase-like deaminating enzyme
MSGPDSHCDVALIGAGIVGLATAWHLAQRHPGRRLVVLEKESAIAAHQTGHNSGVIHSGIYYKPGSLKAGNCRTGIARLKEFCSREGVPFQMCGKVIVATDSAELPRLGKLFERGQANGVDCELIERPRLLEIEPHCAGLRAIHVRDAGIISYAAVARRLAAILQEQGHRIITGARVTAITEGAEAVVLRTEAGEFHAKQVINCAGLHSDRVTALAGVKPSVQIVPFRGEFFELKPAAEHLCRTLIYPVPDEQFPFLGVYLTRVISGGVHCGPNAVLAWSREGGVDVLRVPPAGAAALAHGVGGIMALLEQGRLRARRPAARARSAGRTPHPLPRRRPRPGRLPRRPHGRRLRPRGGPARRPRHQFPVPRRHGLAQRRRLGRRPDAGAAGVISAGGGAAPVRPGQM